MNIILSPTELGDKYKVSLEIGEVRSELVRDLSDEQRDRAIAVMFRNWLTSKIEGYCHYEGAKIEILD